MLKYRPDIDGLRAIAVFSVILFHAKIIVFDTYLLSGGFIGVDIFFVISGFLITSFIAEEIKQKKFSYLKFYERRIRRIFPALFIVVFFSIIFSLIFFLPGDLLEFSQTLITTTYFSSNFFFWKNTGYFFTENEFKPLIHTWSLSVEEQFYILFPISLVLLTRFFKPYTNIFLFSIFFLSIFIAESESRTGSSGSFYLLPTRGWEFLIGIFCALNNKKIEKRFNRIFDDFLSSLGFLMIVFSIIFFKENFVHPGLITLIPTLGTFLIILFSKENTISFKLLSNKFLVFNGLISYSLYLWHQPIFAFSKQIFENFDSVKLIILNITITYIIAIFSWKFIEKPFRNPKKIQANILFLFCISSMIIFTLAGLAIYKSKGFINMYQASDHNLLKNQNQYSNFVWKKSSEISLNNFSNNENIKISVIGDSFSQDLVNSIFQSDLKRKIDASYIGINNGCNKNTKDFICFKRNLSENNIIKKIIENSDYVWIAMSWNEFHVKKIIEILNEKNNLGIKQKVFIFGQKSFSESNLNRKKLLKKSLDERKEIKHKLPERILNLEEKMKNSFKQVKFISLLEIFCNYSFECNLFTKENELISYDGTHLTQEGAKILGKKLNEHPEIKKILTNKSF